MVNVLHINEYRPIEMEFENHLKIVIILSVLFILSTIEGLLDGCFSWTPYNMVHDYEFPENDENDKNDKNNENLVPLVEKGLTDLPKTEGALASPAQPLATALPKTDENNMSINLTKNPDILKYASDKMKDKIVIGFSAETDNIIENARLKLSKKDLVD